MAPPPKKGRSPLLLYLLVGAALLILLCSLLFGYLIFRQTSPDAPHINATSLPQFVPEGLSPTPEATTVTTTKATRPTTRITSTTETSTTSRSTPSTTTVQTTNAPETTIEKATTQQATEATTTATEEPSTTTERITVAPTTEATETTTEEISLPVDTASLIGEEHVEMIAQCAAIDAETVSCAKSTEDFSVVPATSLKPLQYKLNLTVKSVQPAMLQGTVQIYVKMIEEGKQISLHAAPTLRGLDDISIVDCATGKTLCVAKSVYEPREDLMSLLLSDTVPQGTNLRIQVNDFTSIDSRDAVYSLVPPRWQRGAPKMIGSVFGPRSARKVFPSFDLPIYKAPLDLCVEHWENSHVRSNAESSAVDGTTTCFTSTAPLSPQQYAFAAFQRAEAIIMNSTTLDSSYIPAVEMVFSINKQFKREKHQWIYDEASKIIAVFTSWSKFTYPLPKLSLFSAPIQNPANSALGMITIQDRLIEYPSYTMAHVALVRAVIGQWLGGIVSGADDVFCFQDSLTTYIEWKMNEDLSFVNRSRSAEVIAARPKDLSKDGKVEPRRIRSSQGSSVCSERFTAVFYSLDETFGPNTVTGMIRKIFNKFAFSTVTIKDWADAVVAASGKEEAGTVLSEWFTHTTRPVLLASVRSQSLDIKQLTPSTWTVPIEIGGSAGVELVTVSQKDQSISFSSDDYVIVDPARKSTAFVVYDAASYLRVVRCWDASSCPAPRQSLKGAIQDMGAVLLNDMMPANTDEVADWKTLFDFVTTHRLLEGDAACCVAYALRQPADRLCTWVVQDTCPKIKLVQMIAGN